METDIKIGFIGAGGIAGVHMQNFRYIDHVKIVAVTDTMKQLSEYRSHEHGIPVIYDTATELLADESIDAVVIAVPNKYHASLAIEALEAGKHVLLEKPMATNATIAKQILEVQERSGKQLMLAHQMRWEGVYRAMHQEILSGRVGEIYNAKVSWMRKKGIPGWGSWFTKMEESGGGPLIDIGVHMLDLALYMMGSPKPVSVYGSTYAKFGPQRKGVGDWGRPDWNGYYDVEDLASAMIKLDNGATLSLDVSWAAHAACMSQEPVIHLMGTEAGVAAVGHSGQIVFHDDQGVVEYGLHALEGDGRYLMSKHFIECVRENKTPIVSALSGYTNNRILDAIYESSATGHEVKIDWS